MIDKIPTHASIDTGPLLAFVRREILPGVKTREQEGKFPLEIFRRLHSLGWLQAAIPKDLGGVGATATDLAWATRLLAHGSAGVATSFIGNTLGMSPVILYGSPELRERLIAPCQARLSLWSFCMTEPDSGTDIHASRSIARRKGKGYVLEGKKCFITNVNVAEHYVVFARTENADPGSPLTAFYVPANAPGVSRGKVLEKLGHRESDTGEVFFDQVEIPEDHRIGAEGEGIRVAFRSLHRTKTLFAAAAVGTCDRALELGFDFLSKRVHYGKPLIAVPTIRSLLAQLHTEVDASWLLTCLAAATWETGDFAIKEASQAKLFAGHTAVKVTGEVLELLGGYGFTQEYEIERLFRDSKLYEIIEGASFVQQILISKELFPRAPSAARKEKAA